MDAPASSSSSFASFTTTDTTSSEPCLLRFITHASFLPEPARQLPTDQSSACETPFKDGKVLAGLRKWWSSRKQTEPECHRSMVMSATGRYIAVLDGSNITLLTRANGFREAIGSSRGCLGNGFFTCGVWIEDANMFAGATTCKCVVFLDLTGKELYKIDTKQWKVRGHIVGMFLQQIPPAVSEESCGLLVITSDCTLHQIKICSHSLCEADLKESRTIMCGSLKKIYPQGIICSDYNSQKSILALAGPSSVTRISGSAGTCCLSLWRVADSLQSLELLCHTSDLDGLGSFPWIAMNRRGFLPPRVSISPGLGYVGLLDCRARLQLVSLKQAPVWTSQRLKFPVRNCVQRSDGISTKAMEKSQLGAAKLFRRDADCQRCDTCYIELGSKTGTAKEEEEGPEFESLNDCRAASWWSVDALGLLKTGSFSLVDIQDLKIVSNFAISFCSNNMHIFRGLNSRHIFILEDIQVSSPEGLTESNQATSGLATEKTEALGWKLVSFEEHTVTELYKILLDSAEFDSALSLAEKYGLQSEQIYKARWLHSNYGLEELHQNLPKIADKLWVLKECLQQVCPSVEAMTHLLQHGIWLSDSCLGERNLKDAAQDCLLGRFCLSRLRLLQYNDRLETFLGISMGRYNSRGYEVFRYSPLQDVAVNLAESGKVGALSLLYKRHLHSLTPHLFKILNAIPETISPHSYSQLLPQHNPPQAYIAGREKDWVENDDIFEVIQNCHGIDEENCKVGLQDSTEYIVKLHTGFTWPSGKDLTEWYKARAICIDKVSGQLENSLSLLDLGKEKGITGLEDLWEDVSTLYRITYSNIDNNKMEMHISLLGWQQLSDYEKFLMILEGVNEVTVLVRLEEQAIPFMNKTYDRKGAVLTDNHSSFEERGESLLVKWLKDIACKNQLQICATVFTEACVNPDAKWLFKTDIQCIEAGLDCIYCCTRVDQWDLMALTLSKLLFLCQKAQPMNEGEIASPGRQFTRSFIRAKNLAIGGQSTEGLPTTGSTVEGGSTSSETERVYAALNRKIQRALGHVEAGRLLLQYQVSKPIVFLENASNDEKGVKQLLHLLLSKFSRRQPARSDAEWALLWNDMQSLQAKAFSFLNKQFLFLEYYRGLLKAGKFALATTHLKSSGNGLLSEERAETVIIQAAREYFYSASSLDSPEVGKARRCLNLLPGSKSVAAEMGVIDAVTVKLPDLGVSLLPMQVRQMKDPIDIVKMALDSCSLKGSLKVDELLDVAKLLGLNTSDQMAMVEELIAREAAASGQIGLALNLCLGLMKRGYGAIWDLCAALARGPELEGINLKSRKELIGFALSHCDEESIGQLLSVWKEIDLLKRCADLRKAVYLKSASLSMEDAFTEEVRKQRANLEYSEEVESTTSDVDLIERDKRLRCLLLKVTTKEFTGDDSNKDIYPKEKKEILNLLCSQLPWLLQVEELESKTCHISLEKDNNMGAKHVRTISSKNLSSQSAAIILLGLAHSNMSPKDELICAIASRAMQETCKRSNDMRSCGYLLNLVDYRMGVDIFEQELQWREKPDTTCEILELALKYSSLHDAAQKTNSPQQRREKLIDTLWESYYTTVSGSTEVNPQVNSVSGSIFWKDWHLMLLQKLQVAKQALELEEIVPKFEMHRFVSGDKDYIHDTMLSFVESAKIPEKSELTIVRNYDYPQSSMSCLRRETDGIDTLKFDRTVLEEKYSTFKKYLKNLTIMDQWAALQSLMDATSKAVLVNEKNNSEGEQGGCDVSNLCWLLDFWVTAFEDILAWTDRELDEVFSRQAIEYMLKLEKCCKCLKMLIQDNKFPSETAQEVVLKIASSSDFGDTMLLFLKAMISSGCPFQAVVFVWQAALGMIAPSTGTSDCKDLIKFEKNNELLESQSSAECFDGAPAPNSCLVQNPNPEFLKRKESHSLVNRTGGSEILDIYLQVLNSSIYSCLEPFKGTCLEDYALRIETTIKVLASLGSIFELDVASQQEQFSVHQMLYEVRLGVWKRLCELTESPNIPPLLRVCLLKLLGAIIEGQEFTDNVDIFEYYVKNYPIYWACWEVISSSGGKQFPILNIKNTTMALKTTELIASVWPDVELKAEDLLSVEAATSVFCSLAAKVENPQHASLLHSVLEGWGNIFGYEDNIAMEQFGETSTGKDILEEKIDLHDGWGQGDIWDDVWEEAGEKSGSPNSVAGFTVHALHACWKIVFQKLLFYGCLDEVLNALDKVPSKSGKVLLTKEESIELVSSIAQESSVSALKLSLLLPYVDAQNTALESFDKKIRLSKYREMQKMRRREHAEPEGNFQNQNIIDLDDCLLTLVVASGCLSTLAENPKFVHTFSAICDAVASSVQDTAYLSSGSGKRSFMQDIIFPAFVAALTQTNQHAVASALILQLMQVHPAFITWHAAYVALKKFLNAKVCALDDNPGEIEAEGILSSITNSVHHLQSLLRDTLYSASMFLSNDFL